MEEVRFEEFRVSGTRQGDSIRGEIETRFPATRLAWSVNLREPLGFRVEGPFSLGEAEGAAPKDGKRRYSLEGRAGIEGSLRALEKSSGTVAVETVRYREGGLELVGTALSARMDPEGIRWTGGTIVAGGNPLKVSGKVSWKGDLYVLLDGKVPPSVLRLVVPGLFERLLGEAELLTGTRKTYGMNLIGGVRRDILKEQRLQTLQMGRELREEVAVLVNMLLETPNIVQRTAEDRTSGAAGGPRLQPGGTHPARLGV